MNFIKKKINTNITLSKGKLLLLMAFISCLLAIDLNAQTNDKWVLEFGGRVIDDSNGQEMEEVLIILYKDKTEINKVRTTAAGTFLFKVPQDDEFTLVFSKNGYTAKRLNINTKNVPKELSDKTAVFNYRGAKVYLFEVVPDLDVSILDQPIGKIYFDPAQKNFDYDKEYTKSIKTKVEVLSKALEVKKQKESADAALKAKQNAEFNKLLAEGDANLQAKKFDDAVFTYTKALNMNIDKSTCNSKIKAAKEAKEADELAKKQAEFDKFINEGNTLLDSKKFDDAVNQYNKAFLMNFDNPKATERTENAKYLKKKDEFDKYISDGDAQVALKKYDDAVKEYNKGLAMNFENAAAESKIKAAQNFKSDVLLAKKKAEFDGFISAGDLKLGEKKFDEAIKEYNKGLAMNFENTTADSKIKTAQTAKTKDTFDKIIAEGDVKLGEKKFADAVATYSKALAMDYDKPAAEAKIKTCKQTEFDGFIKAGDDLFGQKQFDNAVKEYQKALAMNFDNPSAEAKIKTGQNGKQKDTFDKIIAEGDVKLGEKKFADAVATYSKALAMDYDKPAAEAKIKTCKQTEFDGFIKAGDDLFGQKQFDNAVKEYQKALAMNFDNPSAEAKIKTGQNGKQKDTFDKIIAEGDVKLGEKKYADAVATYSKALAMDYDKPAAEAKIKTCKQTEFDGFLKAGDDLLGQKGFDNAVKEYQKAVAMSFDNPTAEAKIKTAQTAKSKDTFDKIIAEGDVKLGEKKYADAVATYSKALAMDYDKPAAEAKIKTCKQTEFDGYIKAGDDLLAQKQFDNCVKEYQKALAMNFDNPTAEAKITNAKNSNSKAIFDKIIADGDIKLGEKKYADAIKEYQKAVAMNLDNAAAEAKIKNCKQTEFDGFLKAGDDLLGQKGFDNAVKEYQKAVAMSFDNPTAEAKIKTAQTAKSKDTFDKIIAEGDVKLGEKKYADAVATYSKALAMDYDKPAAEAKIKTCKQTEFDGYIKAGDDLLAQKQFDNCVKEYQKALAMNFDNPTAEAKITNAKNSNSKAIFDKIIADGDIKLGEKKYADAIKEYQKAVAMNLDNAAAEAKIKTCKQTEFDGFLKAGDDLLGQKGFDNAVKEYQKAVAMSFDNPTAESKIKTAQTAKSKDTFDKIIAEGDVKLGEKKYADAVATYSKALAMDYDKPAAEAKIKTCKQTEFDGYIKAGDDLLAQKQFDNCVKEYQKALAMNFDNPTAEAKITNAKNSNSKAIFDKIIADGDIKLGEKKYADAIKEYQKAVAMNLDNAAAEAKIKTCKQTEFDGFLKAGDDLLGQKGFDNAVKEYQKAVAMSFDNPTAEAKIKTAQTAKSKDTFDKIIAEGDVKLGEKKFADAVATYSKALAMDYDKPAAEAKIKTCKQTEFDGYIKAGDDLLAQKQFDNCVKEYQKALAMNFDNPTAEAKITNAKNSNSKAIFDKIIADGDIKLGEKKYADAIKEYQKAVAMNLDNPAAEAKIKTCKQTEFDGFLKAGDDLLGQKQFDNAVKEYQKAVAMSFDNPTAEAKIKTAQTAKSKDTFDKIIAEGDVKLGEKKFADAVATYSKALAMDYDKPAAEAKIKTCKQTEFDGYIKAGDDLLAQKQFDNCVKEYQKALAMNFDNPTAEAKITNAKNSNSKAIFDKIIADGDVKLGEKKYADAIKEYQKAVAMNLDNPAAEAKIKNCKQTEFDGFLKAGDDLLGQKGFDNAVKEYQKAVAMSFDNPTAEAKIKTAQTAKSKDTFDKIIAEGDLKLGEKKFADAVATYSKALAMDYDKPAAEAKIKTCKQTEFDGYIKAGDDLLAQKQFDNCVKEYQKALAMNFDNPTAEAKIKNAQNSNTKAIFDKTIAEGDAKLAEKKYADAVGFYNKALAMNVDNPAAEVKIKTCKQTEFDGYIKAGDDLLGQKQFDNAVKEYQKAVAMSFDNPTAEAKIKTAQTAKSKDTFDKIIAEGDVKLGEKKFADAVATYSKALAMDYDKPAAEAKIKTCKQTEFDGFLKAGDDLLGQKQFENAVKEYQKAVAMSFDNPTAEAKIKTAQTAKSKDTFDKIIAEGDVKLGEKKFADAVVTYSKALAMDYDKPAAEAKIKTCKQTEFDGYIKAGDDLLAQKQFDNCVKEYQKALAMNFDNPTAEAKIKNAQNSNTKAIFDKTIAEGDAKLAEKKYADAVGIYNKALAMNVDNPAAEAKIKTCKQTEFDGYIKAGDDLLGQKQFDNAVKEYQKAVAMSFDNPTAEAKIKTAQTAKSKDTFDKIIAEGDVKLGEKKFADAVATYSKALAMDYDKPAAEAKIKTCKQTEFDGYIKAGDDLLAQKQFDNCVKEYQKALAMNFDNPTAEAKIKNAQNSNTKAIFDKTIAEGDAKLAEKKYADAVGIYNKALAMNVDNPAAEAKIKTCKQTEFDGYIKAGDDLLGQKQFDNAVKEYQKAVAMSFDNPTAEAKIKTAQTAKSKDTFDKIIAEGDVKLGEKKYADAVATYSKALAMDYDKPAAEAKIKTCKQTEFDGYIKAGDDLLAQKQFDNCVKEYQKALAMNFDNPTAEAKIKNAQNSNTKAIFDKTIAEGDAKLAEKKYADAVAIYNKALTMNVDNPAAEAKIKTCKQTEFDGYIKAGDDLLGQKQFDNAVKEYQKAVAMSFDNPTAEAKIKTAQTAKSKDTFDKIIAEGDVKLGEKKYADAVATYSKALAMDYDKPAAEAKIKTCKQTEFDGYIKAGDDLLAQKQFDNCVKEYQKALAMNFDNPTAEAKIKNAQNSNTKAIFDKTIAEGDAKLAEKKYADAVAIYNKALTMNVDNPAAEAKIKTCKQTEFDGYIKAGDDLLGQKQFDNAVKEYQKAVAMSFDNPTAEAKIKAAQTAKSKDTFDKIIAEGDVKLGEKKFADAVATYSKALAMDYDKPAAEAKIKTCKQTEFDGYIKVGDDLLAQKQFDNCVKEYQKALAMNFDNPTAEAKIKNAQNSNAKAIFDKTIAEGDAKLAEKKYADAVGIYTKALAMNVDNPAAEAKIKTCKQTEFDGYIKAGDDLLGQKQFDNAVKEYQKAVAMSFDNPTAEAKIKAAQTAKSKDTFDKIIAEGDVKLGEKKFADAVATYSKALAMDYDKPAAEAKIKTCKQTEFDGYIKAGDDILAQKQFDNSVKEYQKALAMNFDNPTAEAKIKNAQNSNTKAIFDKTIAEGDAKLAEKKYADAVAIYNKALAMNVDNPAAEAKIKNCKQTEFNEIVTAGDGMLGSKKYDDAIAQYGKALAMNFDNPTATAKTEAAKTAKAKDAFDAIIVDGDTKLGAKKYDDAIAAYNKALAANFDNPAANAKIKAAQDAKDADLTAKKKAEFDGYITAGDGFLGTKKFDDAIAQYGKALAMNFDNPTATTKTETAKTAKAKDAFDAIIVDGDAKLAAKKYDDAIAAYNKALAANFDNPAANAKIKAAQDAKDADLTAKKKAEFDGYITAGDGFLGTKKFDDAIAQYGKALAMNFDNPTATAKTEAAKTAKAKDAFDAIIVDGDTKLGAKKYDDAITAYNKALAANFDNPAANAKIKAAQEAKDADLTAKKKIEFDGYIAAGDAQLTAKKYDDAITQFNKALAVKFDDATANAKIAAAQKAKTDEADRLKAEAEAKAKAEAEAKAAAELAKKKSEFEAAIKKGDDALSAKKFDDAIASYNSALAVKFDDPTANAKIAAAQKAKTDEADRLKAEAEAKAKAEAEAKAAAELAKKKSEFETAIKKGDDALGAKKFDDAIASYNTALAVKFDDPTANAKIAAAQKAKTDEADRLKAEAEAKAKAEAEAKAAAELAKKKSEFEAAIKKGDDALGAKKFDDAIASYNTALAVKFDDPTANAKIAAAQKAKTDEADRLKAEAEAKAKAEAEAKAAAELAKKKSEFEAAIKKGDDALGAKKFDDAIASYNTALAVKFDDPTANAKIAAAQKAKTDEADRLKAEAEAKAKAEAEAKAAAELAKKKSEFEAAIKKGDDALSAKKFDDAIASYNSALAVKFDDATANAKIAAAQKAKTDEADRLKAEAEAKAKAEAEAKAAAELAKKKSEFEAAIKKGDDALSAKKFDDAIASYNSALAVKFDDATANAKIAAAQKAKTDEADRLKAEAEAKAKAEAEAKAAAELAKKKSEFEAAIKKGDDALGTKKFDDAIASYNAALAVKFDDPTANAKIAAAQKAKTDEAARLKAEADAKAKADADAKLAAEQAKKKAEFEAAIKKGDDALGAKKFDDAIASYNTALAVKFDDPTANAKIASAQKAKTDEAARLKAEADAKAKADADAKLAAEQAKKKSEFDAAIKKGDDALGAKKFDDAIASYNTALAVKFDDPTANAKIASAQKAKTDEAARLKAEADAKAKADADAKLAAEQAKKKSEFDAASKKGDDALGAKKFDDAIASYNTALAVKFDDPTANAKIAAAQKAKTDDAARLKAEADAKAKADADAKLAAEQAKKKSEFDKNIKAGDDKLIAKKYDDAVSVYNQALATKYDDAMANSKITAAQKAKADEEGRIKADADAKARLEALKKAKEEADAKAKIDAEEKAREEAEARAAREAREKILAEVEAAKKLKDDAIKKAAEEARLKAEADAKKLADAEAAKKAKEEQLAKMLAEAEEAKAKQKPKEDPKTKPGGGVQKTEPTKSLTEEQKSQKEADEAEAKAKADLAKKMTEAERELFLSELAKKYPEGVTVEDQVFGKMKITRVIVVKNKKAHEYKKIVFSYGTYYKKDGNDIPKVIFDAETRK